jgi:hypothetical protein
MRSFRPPQNASPPAALPALLRATHLFGLALGSAVGRLREPCSLASLGIAAGIAPLWLHAPRRWSHAARPRGCDPAREQPREDPSHSLTQSDFPSCPDLPGLDHEGGRSQAKPSVVPPTLDMSVVFDMNLPSTAMLRWHFRGLRWSSSPPSTSPSWRASRSSRP